jgi:hypothetical protein
MNDDQPAPRPAVLDRVPASAEGPFPSGTTFLDVEDVPVAFIRFPDGTSTFIAYDPEPRLFLTPSVLRNGTPFSESDFRAAAARFAAEREGRVNASSE